SQALQQNSMATTNIQWSSPDKQHLSSQSLFLNLLICLSVPVICLQTVQ
ncbi:20850_t:CDS:1, partial [Gigaspora rosea]